MSSSLSAEEFWSGPPSVPAPSPASDNSAPRLVLLAIVHNGGSRLADCVASWLNSLPSAAAVVLVDNASEDDAVGVVASQFPSVLVRRSEQNLGYAGGATWGAQWILEQFPHVAYLGVINDDVALEQGTIQRLMAVLDERPECGIAQPWLRLADAPDHLNTVGLDWHVLGYGLLRGYGRLVSEWSDQRQPLAALSGAMFMVRVETVRAVGLFAPEYFMYGEDCDLSVRVRLAGWRIEAVPSIGATHQYTAGASLRWYEWIELNRLRLLLTHYRWRTLLLLAPALALLELGHWLYAVRDGRVLLRCRVWARMCSQATRREVRQRRTESRALRRITDRELLATAVARFPPRQVDLGLAARAAERCVEIWWQLTRRCLWW
jgi:N-acetylglucosaminyl-diphospho-decaprenol L-rhamnosyltransferase